MSKRLIQDGTLPARQVVPLAPWMSQRTDLELPAVQTAGQAVRAGRRRSHRLPEPTAGLLLGTDVGGDRGAPASPTDPPRLDGPSGRRVMASRRLAQLQKRRRRWLAAEEQRTRGLIRSRHPERVAALPRAKGHMSHRLRRWETPGWLVMTRTPGGQTASV